VAPSSLLLSPDGTRLYAAVDNDVAVIDTATTSVVTTVPVGATSASGITALALSPDGASIYATDAVAVGTAGGTAEELSVIGTATDTVTATIPYRGKVLNAGSVEFSPNGRLVYVTVECGGKLASWQIEVVSTTKEKVTSIIAHGSPYPVSATFVGAGARAYVGPLQDTSGGAFFTSVVDTSTGKQISTIPVAADETMTVFADQGRRAFLNTGFAEWVLDTATGKVISTIAPRYEFPGGVVLTPDGTKALVVGNGAVLAVDTTTNAVTDIPVVMGPRAIALTPDGSRAYVTDLYDNAVQIIDTATDTITGSFVVPSSAVSDTGTLGALAFSPDGTELYVADNSSGTISVVDTATDTVTGTIATNPVGGQIDDLVQVIDTATEQVTAVIGLFGIGDDGTGSVAVSPDGTALYATGFSGFIASLSTIDTATDSITTTLDMAAHDEDNTAVAVALTPDGTQAYLTNGALDTVSVIDTATDTVSGTINVGRDASGVVIGP
jgi:YVTN family beta-propeller protein